MKKFATFGLLALVLLMGGCSSKKYFEPEKIEGKISYDGDLPAVIVDVARDGATLANGQVVTKDGLLNVALPKGYAFVSDSEEYVIAAAECGKLIVLSKKDKSIAYENDFGRRVASAKIDKEIMALVLADNSVLLNDWKAKKIIAKTRSDEIYAVDTRIANPYFLGDLVIVPTLDGKLLILDRATGATIRSIVVGADKFLGNVIYLNVLENRLVAATPTKIISVSPEMMNTLDLEIADVIFAKDAITILTKEGRIVRTDIDLKVQRERKYPFAHLIGALYGNYLYAVEKEGYLIATDKNLAVSNIFKLPDSIDAPIFVAQDKIFYKDKFYTLNK